MYDRTPSPRSATSEAVTIGECTVPNDFSITALWEDNQLVRKEMLALHQDAITRSKFMEEAFATRNSTSIKNSTSHTSYVAEELDKIMDKKLSEHSSTLREVGVRLQQVCEQLQSLPKGSALEDIEMRLMKLGGAFITSELTGETSGNTEKVSDSLNGLLEQQSQRLEASFQRQMETALPAAALYFLRCQEAKAKGIEMPLPQTAFDDTVSSTSYKNNHEINGQNSDIMNSNTMPGEEQAAGTKVVGSKVASPPMLSSSTVDKLLSQCASSDEEKRARKGLLIPTAEQTKEARTMTLWEMGETEKPEKSHSWFMRAYDRAVAPRTDLHHYLMRSRFAACVPSKRPDNFLVRIVDKEWFHVVTALVILANTIFGSYTAHQAVNNLLSVPQKPDPKWWHRVEAGFTLYFLIECAMRIMAFRAYFFLARGSIMWNLLDVFVVTVSIVASNLDIVFMRILRIFRLSRLLKVIVETTALAELRNLLFAVVACLVPLFWAVMFLIMTMMMFTLLILQCVASGIKDLPEGHQTILLSEQYFNGFSGCLRTLFSIVVGPDWLPPAEVLHSMGFLPGQVMPLFVVFVQIGVMNIVVGVFADASSGSKDRNSIAQSEIDDLASFCEDIVALLQECAGEDGALTWESFKEYFYKEEVQAYLFHYGLDSTHVQLIYHLIETSSKDGSVNLREFVIGMLRLKGEAKRLDQRVSMHALKVLTNNLELVRRAVCRLEGCLEGGSGAQDSVTEV